MSLSPTQVRGRPSVFSTLFHADWLEDSVNRFMVPFSLTFKSSYFCKSFWATLKGPAARRVCSPWLSGRQRETAIQGSPLTSLRGLCLLSAGTGKKRERKARAGW